MKTETKPADILDADVHEHEPIETRPVQFTDLDVLDTALVLDDPRADAAMLEQKFARREALMRICFRMTTPSQWQVFKDSKTGKSSVYPSGGAADSIIRSILGCTWQEKEITVIRDAKGDPISASATGWLCNRDGHRIEQFTGYRDMGGFVKSESDLRRCCLENMKSVAVRDVLGLRGRTPEELQSLGLDLSKVGVASFANNKMGPGDVPVFAFGRKKGLAANDPAVTLEDLLWYAERAKESIADPAKAKWKGSEEQKLAAYRAEYQRRKDLEKAPAAPADDFPAEDFPAAG